MDYLTIFYKKILQMQKDTGERLQKIDKLASRNKIHKQHYKKFLKFKNSIDLRRELVEK